jgi:hypothetical protein
MIELLKNKELTLNYIPDHGAWTYNIVIPDSRDIKGKWGYIKVSGTKYSMQQLTLRDIEMAKFLDHFLY